MVKLEQQTRLWHHKTGTEQLFEQYYLNMSA